MTAAAPLRVGIVGANPERGWARDAHLPALRTLGDDFTLAAVSARTQAIADAARDAFGAGQAFGDSLALARDPGVDMVVVAVKVPEHRAVVLAALAAGKHVYCEWPLGRDAGEAAEMAAAVPAGVTAAIGLQALSAPALRRAAELIGAGAIGRPRVLRMRSPTAGWGAEAPPHYLYLQDRRNGATLETIAGGHSLAGIEALVGAYREVDARSSILRDRVRVSGSDDMVERTSADHMMVIGRHTSGCVSTLEVVGGTMTMPFALEVEGESGWLRLGGGHVGGYQAGALTLETSTGETIAAGPLDGHAANVAHAYRRLAEGIRAGARRLPDFDDAVNLSRLLDRVERASSSGERQ